MGKYSSLIDIISERYSDMTPVIEVANDFFCEVEKLDPELQPYRKAIMRLEELAYDINKTEAEDIIRKMKPYGLKWTYKEVESLAEEKGIKGGYILWWLSMNMAYNDYHRTAEKFGLGEDTDFYFSIADNFINDVDGDELKVEKYFIKP